MATKLDEPLLFEPIFKERIWGGRRLETEFNKPLPKSANIGESWEVSDRPEDQSVVKNGPFRASSLHDLWKNHREEIFGHVPDAPRFPLLIKLLDARETLSLQVHPPAHTAPRLGGDPKTEFWYVAKAEKGALIYAGLREEMTAADFERSVTSGTIEKHIHAISVREGDSIFLPAGRFHAIGAGNLLVEIQQNSDTTYRVYDWDRCDDNGRPRELHIRQALECIDFSDCQPSLIEPKGELLVENELFEIQKWDLRQGRELSPPGQFAILCVLEGNLECSRAALRPGDFCLLPAANQNRMISPLSATASVLRITIPFEAKPVR